MNNLPSIPDIGETIGLWMEPKELRKRNRELATYGRRICRTHQGRALPLTEEYFYYANRSTGQFQTECVLCFRERDRHLKANRYARDAEFREHLLDQQRRSVERKRYNLEYKRRRKCLRLTAILRQLKAS